MAEDLDKDARDEAFAEDSGDASGEAGRVLDETLRPKIPMGFYVGAPYAAALGLCEALAAEGLTARIAWPHDVVVVEPDGGTSARVRVTGRGGYDEDGMFCALAGDAEGGLDLADYGERISQGVRDRFDAWEGDVQAKRGVNGPLAAFLSDYFDLVGLMGQQVDVRYPNGRLMGTGRFSGMDVWGRATITLDDGHEIEITPEQASIRPHS